MEDEMEAMEKADVSSLTSSYSFVINKERAQLYPQCAADWPTQYIYLHECVISFFCLPFTATCWCSLESPRDSYLIKISKLKMVRSMAEFFFASVHYTRMLQVLIIFFKPFIVQTCTHTHAVHLLSRKSLHQKLLELYVEESKKQRQCKVCETSSHFIWFFSGNAVCIDLFHFADVKAKQLSVGQTGSAREAEYTSGQSVSWEWGLLAHAAGQKRGWDRDHSLALWGMAFHFCILFIWMTLDCNLRRVSCWNTLMMSNYLLCFWIFWTKLRFVVSGFALLLDSHLESVSFSRIKVNVFYSGCVIAEVRDYRRSLTDTYDTHYVLLQPTAQVRCSSHSGWRMVCLTNGTCFAEPELRHKCHCRQWSSSCMDSGRCALPRIPAAAAHLPSTLSGSLPNRRIGCQPPQPRPSAFLVPSPFCPTSLTGSSQSSETHGAGQGSPWSTTAPWLPSKEEGSSWSQPHWG